MRGWTLTIDQGLLRVAVRRLMANIVIIAAIAVLLPFLNATLVEVLWVAALCVGVAVVDAGVQLLIASAKMAKLIKGSASCPSEAPRSQPDLLR